MNKLLKIYFISSAALKGTNEEMQLPAEDVSALTECCALIAGTVSIHLNDF